MKQIKSRYPLYLKHSKKKGWGVYCSKPIPKGRVFETAPIIYLPKKLLNKFNNTPVDSYRFEYWGDNCALVMGYGSLYNHSKEANAEHRVNRKSKTYSFYAIKNIPANTEICHDYNWDFSEYKKQGMEKTKPAKHK